MTRDKPKLKRRHRMLWAVGLAIVFIGCAFSAGQAKDWVKATYAAHAPRETLYPASTQPDQICLTWSADPATSQTIQWRTAPTTDQGVVEIRKDEGSAEVMRIDAQASTINDPLVQNDPLNNRYTATITALSPGSTYAYRVGVPASNAWSDWFKFSTAPAASAPFAFAYLGDVQIGFDEWANLLQQAYARQPSAAFYVIPGDLANRGNNRDDWDNFFNASRGIFDQRPLVPSIGNHECPRHAEPRLYLNLLALPENGPKQILPERVYSLKYGNALFVALDPNIAPELQRSWLENQLADTKAMWKFVIYHQPAYSSVPYRGNPEVRKYWSDLFDKYHVDVALQGHDHAYLRTYPMNAGKVVDSSQNGTIYIIAVSGQKFYEQGKFDYAAVAIPEVATYQIIDIQTDPENVLTYRAYDGAGVLRDEFKKIKPAAKSG